MRSFQYVPFGKTASTDTICCDGLVSGSTFHLSHWAGNITPARYRADTSTGIVLRFDESPDPAVDGWSVVNNHFDTDGAFAVWALLHPDLARPHGPLLVAAAEAGDFSEWNDANGVRLEFAVTALSSTLDDASAYTEVFRALPSWLDDITVAKCHWNAPWERLLAEQERVDRGDVVLSTHERIVAVVHGDGGEELPAFAVNRAVTRDTRRILVCVPEGSRWNYRYERPGWSWADTVDRPAVPVPDCDALGEALGAAWRTKGREKQVTILRTHEPVADAPGAVIARLLALDAAARFEGEGNPGLR